MTDRGWCRETSAPGGAAQDAASALRGSDEPTLDQLLAEPIVRLLMHRDRTDEATIRHLLEQASPARPASQARDGPSGPDPNTIVRLLDDTARLARSRYDRELRARLPGMTCARCAVLSHLAQHKVFSQTALAQILDIRPTTLVRLLDRLEAAGFVERMPDPFDRRAHLLALTAEALPIIESIHDLNRKTCNDLRLGISEAEASQLRALLSRIRSDLAAARLNDDPPGLSQIDRPQTGGGHQTARRRRRQNGYRPVA
jgi:MarR family transcriptional regulator, transcriptional regulator for hemolysin